MGANDRYILDADGNVKVEPDLLTWARWFENAERHVALDRLPNGARVSTVFLGLDHNWSGGPPILWETMVFDTEEPWQGYQDRYATREAALAGHKRIVERINAGKGPED